MCDTAKTPARVQVQELRALPAAAAEEDDDEEEEGEVGLHVASPTRKKKKQQQKPKRQERVAECAAPREANACYTRLEHEHGRAHGHGQAEVQARKEEEEEREQDLNDLESRGLLCELCYASEKTVEIRPW